MAGPWPDPPQYYEPPKIGYKVILQQPQFPIIYPDPTMSQVVSNMRPAGWGLAAAMAAAGGSLGYWKGAQVHWQRPAMYFGALLLGKSGLAWAMQDCAYRLMGYKENGREVANNMPGQIKPEQYGATA